MSKKIPLLAASLTLIACSFAMAQGNNDGEKKRRGPPAEAFEACASLSEGDTCSFEGRRGAVEGTCRTGPQGEKLACAPARRGR